MFILRRINSEGSEVNTSIGEQYHYIQKPTNKEEYKRTLESWLKGLKRDDDDIYGFVISNSGAKITPLYKKSVYFIMISNGQTFANISQR